MEKTRILPNITFSSIFSSVVGVALLGGLFGSTEQSGLASLSKKQNRVGLVSLPCYLDHISWSHISKHALKVR